MRPPDVSDPRPPFPALRHRARRVFAALIVIDLLLALGLWGDAFGLPDRLASLLLVLAAAGVLMMLVVGLEPFRRWEMRFEGKSEPETVHGWQVGLFVLVPLAVCVPAWHFLSGEPWRRSIARAVGLFVYLSIVYVLARVQRRGVAPDWRPAWYGFFLAAVTAVLVWSVAAGASVTEGLATAFTGPLLHYAYVRWNTGSGAADSILPGEEPTG